MQDLDLIVVQIEFAAINQQLAGFACRERELAGAYLAERSPSSQPSELEGRVGSGDHDEAGRGRESLDGVAEGRQALAVANRLQIVEHERDRLTELCDSVHDLVNRDVHHRCGRVQPVDRSSAEAVADTVHSRGHVNPQPGGLVVPRVERHPRELAPAVLRPRAHRRRLPVPGGSRNQR